MVLECLDFPAVVARQKAAERKRLRREDDDGADDEGTNDETGLKNEAGQRTLRSDWSGFEVWLTSGREPPGKATEPRAPQNLRPGQSMANARF
jgi:hypothetical protein